jgi:heme-degrading monooxygenase HmoA
LASEAKGRGFESRRARQSIRKHRINNNKGKPMTAMNVVRFRVKPGCEQQFIDAHRGAGPNFRGFLGGRLIRTGDRTFCIVAEWRSFDAIAAARPEMIAMLDSMRDLLEDLGGGLGVTDPVSGDVVVKLDAQRAPRKATKKKSVAKKKTKNRTKAARRKRR